MAPSAASVLSVIALLGLSACEGSTFDRARFYAARMISHEMGAIDGNTYLSCRECFEQSYAHGQRYLEADLMQASDGKIVAMHDGEEARFGLPQGFTSTQFMSIQLLGKYTPLDGPGLAALMKEKPDWYLVTDVKTDNRAGLTELCAELDAAGIDCRERVLPQIYAEGEIAATRALGFDQVIFTLYALPDTDHTVDSAIAFAFVHPEVVAITMPIAFWNERGERLLGDPTPVPIYLHTIDDPTEEQTLFSEGVTGLYSDTLPPAR